MKRSRRGNRVRLADLSPEAQEQARAQLAEQDRAPRPEAAERDAPPDILNLNLGEGI